MSLLDLILNIAGLLLWITWRYVPFDPIQRARPATLTGTLRRAEPLRVQRWHFLGALLLLLVLRALFYWWIGGALDWAPGINLGTITIAFRSDILGRMFLFSLGSFTATLMVFYLSVLVLWMTGPRNADADPCQRFLRIQLGALHQWPGILLGLLPLLLSCALWISVAPLLTRWQIVPRAESWLHLLEQGVVLGLGVYLVGKHVVGAVLGLHLLNTYVYVGGHPAWNFIHSAGKRLLAPLRPLPLRFGKMDFAPLLGIAIVYGMAELLEYALRALFARLPL